jgi:hypothetical protein
MLAARSGSCRFVTDRIAEKHRDDRHAGEEVNRPSASLVTVIAGLIEPAKMKLA